MLLSLLGLLFVTPIGGIVNPAVETSNMVIYMRKPSELFDTAKEQHGLECTKIYLRAFFEPYKRLTRALNIMYTVSGNLSKPTAFIQDKLLLYLHETTFLLRRDRRFRVSIATDDATEAPAIRDTASTMTNDFYILILDNLASFKRLIRFRLIQSRDWNPTGYFFILYDNPADYQNETAISSVIFSELRRYFVNNIGILYARDVNLYVFLINNYLNAEKCRSFNYKVLGECRNGKSKPEPGLLPYTVNKFLKAYGKNNCTVRVCTTVAQPFVGEDCKDGIEMKLLNTVRSHLKVQVGLTQTNGN